MSILSGTEQHRIIRFYWNSLDILFVVHRLFLVIKLNRSTLLHFSQTICAKKAINIIIDDAILVYRDIHMMYNVNQLVVPYLTKNRGQPKFYLSLFSRLIFPRVFLRFFPCVHWKLLGKIEILFLFHFPPSWENSLPINR